MTKEFLNNFKNKKLVATGGCFDLLHRGHLHYLAEARKLGDGLIVFLNSDLSVKSLKGEKRPINSEEERKYFLENLKSVDCVEVFTEDTPERIISDIRPSIWVKGGDYKPEELPEYKLVKGYGGEVQILKFIEGYSSTALIKKIKEL